MVVGILNLNAPMCPAFTGPPKGEAGRALWQTTDYMDDRTV
jgi:hypothetical protein